MSKTRVMHTLAYFNICIYFLLLVKLYIYQEQDIQSTWDNREPRLEANSMYKMYNQHEEDNTLQNKCKPVHVI